MAAHLMAVANASRGKIDLRRTVISITAPSHTDVLLMDARKRSVRNKT